MVSDRRLCMLFAQATIGAHYLGSSLIGVRGRESSLTSRLDKKHRFLSGKAFGGQA